MVFALEPRSTMALAILPLPILCESAAVERLLVRVEGIHRLLALDHVVLEHVGRDRRADLFVVLVDG